MIIQPTPKKLFLGKPLPKHDDRTLQFSKYVKLTDAQPDSSAGYSKLVKNWGMMLNDKYGDCTIAAICHMILLWTAVNGKELVIPDEVILEFYNHFAKGNADAGASMLDVQNYWRSTGIAGDKLLAFAQLDLRNRVQLKQAVNLFGGAYLGVALPNFAVPRTGNVLEIDWVVPARGAVGKAAPNPKNGHAICVVDYDPDDVYVVTWGAVKRMSWEFYEAYAVEVYADLDEDWINQKHGLSPSGFNLVQLKKDLKLIKDAA